jgi:hypothetical protein
LARKDDVVTIVIDAKNETKKAIDGLDVRLTDVEREVRGAIHEEVRGLHTPHLADLKASQHETRTSAYNAGKRASEALTAVTGLRGEVDQLHKRLDALHSDVGEILALLRAPVPVAVPVPAAAAYEEVGAGLGQETVPGPRLAPSTESVPTAPDAAVGAAGASDGPEPEVAAQGDGARSEAEEVAEVEPFEPEANEGVDTAQVAADAELGADSPGGEVKEPEPLSEAGRIWAVMRAGQVASATLVCHRDTWEFVAAQVGSHSHFRAPALEEREHGLVAAVLSGRSLVAALLSLYRTAEVTLGGEEDLTAFADWAMASQVYRKIARALSTAVHADGDPVVVTIDARVPARP